MKYAKRPYRLKKRAEAMTDTRRRITQAAMELHGSVGPARTTVSAVAERAGVQRHTVYRHFPTDDDLFAACSAHFDELHPWPDTEAWRGETDPALRLETALGELYDFYAVTASMWANLLRDAELVPSIPRAMASAQRQLDEMVQRAGVRLGGPRRPARTAHGRRPPRDRLPNLGVAGGARRPHRAPGSEPDARSRRGRCTAAQRAVIVPFCSSGLVQSLTMPLSS